MSAGKAPTGSMPFHEELTRWGADYLKTFGSAMPARQREVLGRTLQCRTAPMGGSLYACLRCGEPHYAYHSCNDRHCPQCGQTQADAWLAGQTQRLLLPCPTFW